MAKKKIEELLDERFDIALQTDIKMGNKELGFLTRNPDYILYKGMLQAIETLGYCWHRTMNGHKVYKGY